MECSGIESHHWFFGMGWGDEEYLRTVHSNITYKRFGNKLHYLFHIWEWCAYYRYSPAWIDDQRAEAFNLRIRLYWQIMLKARTRVGVIKMVNTMTRSSTQAVGRGIGMKTIKETNKVMREHRTGYYKRRRDGQQHQSLSNIPISSDMTYGRLGQYEDN